MSAEEVVVHQHRGYVQSTRSGGHFAVCGTCGWQGPEPSPAP